MKTISVWCFFDNFHPRRRVLPYHHKLSRSHEFITKSKKEKKSGNFGTLPFGRIRQTSAIKIFRRLFLFKFFFKSFFLPFPKFQNLLPKLFFCTKANPIKFQFSAFEKKSFNANLWNWAFYFIYIFVLFLRNFYSESFCKDKKMQNIEQTWFPNFFNGTIN